MDHEEYKRKALEPIVNYIESVMASYSKEELEARIKKALPDKESEDERIRKGIIEFLTDGIWRAKEISKVRETQKYAKWISYLEKQKDEVQKQFNLGVQAGREEVLYEMDKEHKITRWKSLGECSDIPDGHYVVGLFRIGDFRLGIMCNGLFVDPNGNRAEQPKEVFYIPNADEEFVYAEQKPAEWSEEDEKNIEKLDGFLSEVFCYGHVYLSQKDKEELQSWLKSLRPQLHWKPNEEQMEALNAINCHGALSYVGQQEHLISLYNDIKKL